MRREKKSKKPFKVLSCVIYTILDNYVCIDYLACQWRKLSEVSVDGKYSVKYFNKFLGIGIPDLLMNFLSCHGFTKNIKSIVILNVLKGCWNTISKIFGILERNSNSLKKILNLVKQIIHSEETHDSDYVMTCNTIITYI